MAASDLSLTFSVVDLVEYAFHSSSKQRTALSKAAEAASATYPLLRNRNRYDLVHDCPNHKKSVAEYVTAIDYWRSQHP